MRTRLIAVAAALIAVAPARALADQPHPAAAYGIATPEHREPDVELSWYGWQLLLADTLSTSLALATEGGAYPVFVLGGPAVHIGHRNYGRAAVSAGLRVALPLLGATLGLRKADQACDEDPDCWGFEVIAGGALGGLIGMGAAAVIDAVALSWTSRERAAPERAAVEPYLAPRTGGLAFGVRGSF